MGIGRKSRKLKGKKRQTGRKIRRGTRRSRLGRMSRMKGGATSEGTTAAAGNVAEEDGGDAVESVLNDTQQGCDSLKGRLEALSDSVKNAFEEEAQTKQAENEIMKQENADLKEQLGKVTDELRTISATAKQAAAAHQLAAESAKQEAQGAAAEAQTEMERLKRELAVAQERGGDVEGLQRKLEQARFTLNQKQAEVTESTRAAAVAKQKADELQLRIGEYEQQKAIYDSERETLLAESSEKDEALAAKEAETDKRLKERQKEFDQMIIGIGKQVETLRKTCVEEVGERLNILKDRLIENKCLPEGS